MREPDLPVHVQLVAFSDGQRRGGPFTNPIEREHGRLFKRGRVKGAGRMAEVVFRKEQAPRPIDVLTKAARQIPGDALLLEQLVLQPNRQRPRKRAKSRRRGRPRQARLTAAPLTPI